MGSVIGETRVGLGTNPLMFTCSCIIGIVICPYRFEILLCFNDSGFGLSLLVSFLTPQTKKSNVSIDLQHEL